MKNPLSSTFGRLANLPGISGKFPICLVIPEFPEQTSVFPIFMLQPIISVKNVLIHVPSMIANKNNTDASSQAQLIPVRQPYPSFTPNWIDGRPNSAEQQRYKIPLYLITLPTYRHRASPFLLPVIFFTFFFYRCNNFTDTRPCRQQDGWRHAEVSK